VVAVISGGSNRVIAQGSPLKLDASLSMDGNIDPSEPQGLIFKWSCQITSVTLYLQSCSHLFMGTADAAIANIATSNMITNTTYIFSVLVTARDKSSSSWQRVTMRCVSSSAKLSVSISPLSTAVSASSYLLNRNEKMMLEAVISSNSAVFSEWSIPITSGSSVVNFADVAYLLLALSFLEQK